MLHDLIIWSNAATIKDFIVDDLRVNFELYKIFQFRWKESDFIGNLTTFYAHSQRHLNEKHYENLLKHKMVHCGIGDFYVIVFEDKNPVMEKRQTSSGGSLVNVNVFDKKTYYRELSGGGHKIHTSNDEWETNKDLTILFGKNIKDFLLETPKSLDIEICENNCLGTNGFKSIQQLFYLLNNTLNYCVLRNHECLPDQYTSEAHGDIDLLVEDKNYAKYLTQAKDVYNIPYRVYHTIQIAGEEVPFDFRYLGDDYYDIDWEVSVLQTRQFLQKGFYVPSDENQYYTLLYHAYVQKSKVAKDYEDKLSFYASSINTVYVPTVTGAMDSLDVFMGKKLYEYVRPSDKTVYFNNNAVSQSHHASRHGKMVSKLCHDESKSVPFFSVVYEKDNSFYKRASDFLIENEVQFLQRLSQYDCFPKVLASGVADDGAWVETARVEGVKMDEFFSKKQNNKPLLIRSLMKETIAILRILVENRVLHRDFIDRNILVKDEGDVCKVSLIDFGWAIDFANRNECLKPEGLGSVFRLKTGYSDFYTFGKVLDRQWHLHEVPYIKRVALGLETVLWKDYEDVNCLLKKLDTIEGLVCRRFSVRDRIGLFAYRHRTVGKCWLKLKRFLKIFRK